MITQVVASSAAALAAYYGAADCLVCVSEHEGFCVPLLEAMHFHDLWVSLISNVDASAIGTPTAVRNALLRQVAGAGQVIITSVEAGPFPPELISSARVWTVLGGEISTCG